MLARFSTVAGEAGSPDTWRGVRGFLLKFYTDEGNYDLVGNNTPVFLMRDPMKLPHFIRSQKRLPDSCAGYRRGADVAIVDFDNEKIQAVADKVRKTGRKATVFKADVSDRSQVYTADNCPGREKW